VRRLVRVYVPPAYTPKPNPQAPSVPVCSTRARAPRNRTRITHGSPNSLVAKTATPDRSASRCARSPELYDGAPREQASWRRTLSAPTAAACSQQPAPLPLRNRYDPVTGGRCAVAWLASAATGLTSARDRRIGQHRRQLLLHGHVHLRAVPAGGGTCPRHAAGALPRPRVPRQLRRHVNRRRAGRGRSSRCASTVTTAGQSTVAAAIAAASGARAAIHGAPTRGGRRGPRGRHRGRVGRGHTVTVRARPAGVGTRATRGGPPDPARPACAGARARARGPVFLPPTRSAAEIARRATPAPSCGPRAIAPDPVRP
jgi:hypothetical protein